MGAISVKLLLVAGLAAWGGGYLGTKVMHARMRPATVKMFLGSVLLLLAVKLVLTHQM
jgi:uncharacterized membrane protein YfcA